MSLFFIPFIQVLLLRLYSCGSIIRFEDLVFVHHLPDLRDIRHIEYLLKAEVLINYLANICFITGESLDQIFRKLFQPIILSVHKVEIGNKQAISEVLLKAKDWIIHYDAIFDIAITSWGG